MLSLTKRNRKRKKIIREVLDDLESLRKKDSGVFQYTIEKNIEFFKSLRFPGTFLFWLIFRMPKLDRGKILELSDFGLEKWETILQEELLELERRKVPDILAPLRKEIISNICELSNEGKGKLVLVNIGCGAMEVEKQIISKLKKLKNKQTIEFVGVDSSEVSLDAARLNLKKAASSNLYKLRLIKGDALDLKKEFKQGGIDLIYHSKFKHHLPDNLRKEFDTTLTELSGRVIEFDDCRSLYLPIFSLLFNWNKPILMNGALFSYLRVPTKEELRSSISRGWKTKILPIGGYLRIYKHA